MVGSNNAEELLEVALEVLHRYWGFKEFRAAQKHFILNLLRQEEAIGVMPTGGGKSICFQIPGLMMGGVTLVISPLIALIDDQVRQLSEKGISAVALHSRLNQAQYFLEVDNIINGKYKFIYVSPEKLLSNHFQSVLPSFNVHLLAIDEAHCISMWGFDFRPAYRKLSDVIAENPSWKVCALTASATDLILKDIRKELFLEDAPLTRISLYRKNLNYAVIFAENLTTKIISFTKKMSGSGLIYTRSRKETREIALLLNDENINADYYHAGLPQEERKYKQERWMSNEIQVMVCTNAFGMGIDKADVQFVFHAGPPENLANYYQEAGRAGRDGNKAYAGIFFSNQSLKKMEKYYLQEELSLDTIKVLYDQLHSHYGVALGDGEGSTFPFHPRKLVNALGVDAQLLHKALKLFTMHGILQLSENYNKSSTIRICLGAKELEAQSLPSHLTNLLIVLQRKYANIFSQSISIDESFLCSELSIPKQVLDQYLQKLDDLGVVEYSASTDVHYIQFLKDRQRLFIASFDTMQTFSEMQKIGYTAMANYLTEREACRNQIIGNHFGMPQDLPCGHCDNCKKLKKEATFNQVFKEKAKNIKKQVLRAKSRKEVLDYIRKDALSALVLRELMDRRVAEYKNNRWIWRAK